FLGAVPAWADSDSLTISPPETVTVRPGTFEHVRAGEFLQGGRPARAPRRAISVRRPLEIMRYQVTLADYGKCVSQGACSPADGRGPDDGPVTGVSYLDATAYAEWLSDVTGDRWRLPRSEEHTSELQSRENLVCRLLLEKKKEKEIHSKPVERHRHQHS